MVSGQTTISVDAQTLLHPVALIKAHRLSTLAVARERRWNPGRRAQPKRLHDGIGRCRVHQARTALRDRIVTTRLVVETIMSVNTNVQSIRLRGSGQISTTNHGGRVMSIRNLLHSISPVLLIGCNCWMA